MANAFSPFSFILEAIGTKWQIDILNGPEVFQEPKERGPLFSKIKNKIEIFEQTFSRFRQDSLVTKMSQEKGTYDLPEDFKPLFDLYEKCYRLTGGLMTPLIGNMLSDAGYDRNYSLKPGVLEKIPPWEAIIDYRFPRITIKKPTLLDFGAAGKGYAIDLVAEFFQAENITSFCIDAGGDIRSQDRAPISVALEDPRDSSKAIGIASIQNQSICGSAGNRRAWGNFHHIMNPSTLGPVQNILAVWAVADTAMHADALTTALFLAPSGKIIKELPGEYLILYPDSSIEKSKNFPGEVFGDTPSLK